MKQKSITLEVDPTIMENNMRIVKENPVEEELNKLLADTVPSQTVKPRPGFCVKTFTKPDSKKVFVNICLTEAIPSPVDISNAELMQILNSDDPSSYRVPMSIGEGRTEQDKSGASATVYDVAINPEFFSKIEKDDLFQTFFLTVVFEGLQDKYQFELDMQKFTILKNRKSIGTLQSHRIQIRDVKKCEEKAKPLIEEIHKPAKISELAPAKKKEFVYRLRREPPTGEIEYLLAEFMVPASVELKDLNLEIGEDRLVLDSKGLFESVDFFLPCSVDQDIVDAQLNRNKDMLYVKMPIIH
ncbi:PIH1 domain-containing protein 1-like isoform X1 [Maniola hyperantus]|uniref:PIH1 domain-containing protein 1-like isoform X1 n=1 Tax=Aphantopus hyperantus TaxID=2795564 RepID=UPI001569AFC7|nr:PIH1 domain-containing protein 1-like [Maniola hyperantus]